jgi:hypothetical protein
LLRRSKIFTLVTFAVISFSIGTMFSAMATDGGNPWNAVWAAITGLESRVETLEEQTNLTATRYYTIPAPAWLPWRDTNTFYRGVPDIYTTTVGETYWYAAVNLPHGAVITELTAWVLDNDSTWDVTVALYRQLTGTTIFPSMTYATSTGQSSSYEALSDSTIVESTIDNENNAYMLYGILRSGDDNHRLGAVRITYTITEPLP